MSERDDSRADRQFQALRELLAENASIDRDVLEISKDWWAIHGIFPYDGEVPMAVFDTYDEAKQVLDRVRADALARPSTPAEPPAATWLARERGTGISTMTMSALPAMFTPYLAGDAASVRSNRMAYLPVRITDAPRSDGSVLVYLPDGTAMVVNGRHLLCLDAEQNAGG